MKPAVSRRGYDSSFRAAHDRDEDDGATRGASLSVQRLGKRFLRRDGSVLDALQDVTIDVEPGTFLSIVGPSGCGKSTLLMLVAGLEKASAGAVYIDGERVTQPGPVMGVAFQRDNLMPWRTVLANVLAQVDLRGWRAKEWTPRAMELLEMVGLADFRHSYPKELSGGMRQRVALCRALLHHPRILLLDEPFGAVDAMTREQLNIDVGRLCADSNVTTLLVTHDINEAAYMGDKVVVMQARPGRVAGIVDIAGQTPRGPEFRGTQEFLDATTAIRGVLESHHSGLRSTVDGEEDGTDD